MQKIPKRQQKLLELKSKFGKFIIYNTNKQKSIIFVLANKFKIKFHFKSLKKIKYIGVNQIKHVYNMLKTTE